MALKQSVAIATMHRVLNYGSILQTLALYRYLESIGYAPIVIDYIFPNEYHKAIASRASVPEYGSRFRAHLNGLCNRVLKPDASRKASGFSDIFNRYIRLTKPYKNEEEINRSPVEADIYLTGSDQVWNPRYIGRDLTFFLSWIPDNKKRISYGSSFGTKNLSEADLSFFSPWLKKYDAISVREYNEILPSIGLKNNIVLDPTFLLDKNDWLDYFNPEPIITGKYILCYLIGYSFDPFPYAYEVIRHIKLKTGYQVVMIAGEPLNILKGYKVINDCTPSEFLNLFYNASYVVSSSFHGTAFAVNFGIPFTTITDGKSDKDNRQASLLELVGLGRNGILKTGQSLDELIIMPPDYKAPLLELRRTESKDFLKASLSDNNV